MEVESYHLSMTTPPPAPRDDVPTYAGERVKAFADAVVAIAMTLLILPLMESIADVAASDLSAAQLLFARMLGSGSHAAEEPAQQPAEHADLAEQHDDHDHPDDHDEAPRDAALEPSPLRRDARRWAQERGGCRERQRGRAGWGGCSRRRRRHGRRR